MAFVAYIMTVDASGLAHFLLMTYAAFHQHILIEILERRFADKTFFFHNKRIFPTKLHLSPIVANIYPKTTGR